ncbi:hypothetical protein ACEPAG_8820 [Sanghuangporus baumii]
MAWSPDHGMPVSSQAAVQLTVQRFVSGISRIWRTSPPKAVPGPLRPPTPVDGTGNAQFTCLTMVNALVIGLQTLLEKWATQLNIAESSEFYGSTARHWIKLKDVQWTNKDEGGYFIPPYSVSLTAHRACNERRLYLHHCVLACIVHFKSLTPVSRGRSAILTEQNNRLLSR